jgi:hypothetical protein
MKAYTRANPSPRYQRLLALYRQMHREGGWTIDGDSPWFPAFRVYRQQADRSWDNALTRLAEDLQAI